jgi:amino acid transporter
MEAVAIAIVALFSVVNMCGIRWVARLAIPVATASASLAFISALAPILTGDVDWKQAFDYHLTTPFEGWFGDLTAVMAGLYLIGFAAPAFEAAACHVGETIDPTVTCPAPCSPQPRWPAFISSSCQLFGSASSVPKRWD